MTFLKKVTVEAVLDTTDGCPGVGIITEQYAHGYDFIPMVIARVEEASLEEIYDLPVQNLEVGGFPRCGINHGLRLYLAYTIDDTYVNINYSGYCQGLIMGLDSECISSLINFKVYLYFYMWELGSDWPE